MEEDEGLDSGNEDDALDINFEDFDDDVGMNKDMVVAEDVVHEEGEVEVKRNEKGKKKGTGKCKGEGKGKWKGKGKGKGKWKGKRKGKGKGKMGRPPRQPKKCEGSGEVIISDDCVDEEETNVKLKGLSDIEDEKK
ncbi:unnamed protein product [Lathyrus sativus]|nr:unnamed protein product [Lathyrus sativus]